MKTHNEDSSPYKSHNPYDDKKKWINESFLEKYPFSYSQLEILLHFHEAQCINSPIPGKHPVHKDGCMDIQSGVFSTFQSPAVPQQVKDGLDWIETNLILPYYPPDWLYLLVESGRMHSSVVSTECDDDDDDDDQGEKEIDEGNVLQKVHLFFETMAGLSGRRSGSLWEVKVLYSFLEKLHCSSHDDAYTKNDGGEDKDRDVDLRDIIAEDVIALVYRLALSCHVLQKCFDQMLESLNLELISKLGMGAPPQAMVDSLNSYNVKEEFPGETDHERKKRIIDFTTLNNWIEMTFPQMASILSTFVHQVFFSWQCPLTKDLKENTEESNESDDDSTSSYLEHENINEVKSILYAQGKRKNFQFPQLKKAALAPAPRRSLSSPATTTTSSIDVSSIFFDLSMGGGGRIGHFAFGVACMDPMLCGKWHRIYSTENDGCAFQNLQRSIVGYAGPTIMIIRPTRATALQSDENEITSPGLFGFYTNNKWNESNKFYGSSDCFLFRAEPTWNVYRPQGLVQNWNRALDEEAQSKQTAPAHKLSKTKENYMYLYPSTHSLAIGKGKSTKPRGIVLGGTEDHPRLHITETLEQCVASSGGFRDDTFESGPLLPGLWDKYCNIDILEVWAVGGDSEIISALLARDNHIDVADTSRRQMQKVDKKKFVDDFQSGLLFGGTSKMFEDRSDGRVRHDFSTGS